jgi:hypothetical protein
MVDVWAGLSTRHATPVWSIGELPEVLDPELRERLSTAVRSFECEVPLAPLLLPFEQGPVVRPGGHRRCFYLRLGADMSSSHLGVKGTEPVLIDQLRLLLGVGVHRARMLPHRLSGLDFFPIHEHKAPMLLRVAEAVDEAHIGSEVYGAYVQRYGEEPPLPLPLLALRWPEEITRAYWELMEPELSPWAREITARLIADGAGCYIYHYPRAPFPRVRHFAMDFEGDRRSRRFREISAKEAPALTIERWARLFTRLLALGYLPGTESQVRNGQAVQAQNAIVGGGFVDLDSLRRVSSISDEWDLVWSYALSIQVLTATIATYLFDDVNETENASGQYDLCLSYVYDLVARLAEEDASTYGDAFHPKLRALPPFSRDLGGLLEIAKILQGQPRLGDLTGAIDLRAQP